jgi:hypothetical protein
MEVAAPVRGPRNCLCQPSKSAKSPRDTGRSRRSVTCRFRSRRARSSACLVPTGPARRRTMKILTGYIEPDDGDAKVQDLDVVVGAARGSAPTSATCPRARRCTGDGRAGVPDDDGRRSRQMSEGERLRGSPRPCYATGLEQDRMVQPIGDALEGLPPARRHRPGHHAQAGRAHPRRANQRPRPHADRRDPRRSSSVSPNAPRCSLSTHILSEVEATCDRAIMIMNGTMQAPTPSSSRPAGRPTLA